MFFMLGKSHFLLSLFVLVNFKPKSILTFSLFFNVDLFIYLSLLFFFILYSQIIWQRKWVSVNNSKKISWNYLVSICWRFQIKRMLTMMQRLIVSAEDVTISVVTQNYVWILPKNTWPHWLMVLIIYCTHKCKHL